MKKLIFVVLLGIVLSGTAFADYTVKYSAYENGSWIIKTRIAEKVNKYPSYVVLSCFIKNRTKEVIVYSEYIEIVEN